MKMEGFPFVARDGAKRNPGFFIRARRCLCHAHVTFLDSASLHPGYNSKADPHAPYFRRRTRSSRRKRFNHQAHSAVAPGPKFGMSRIDAKEAHCHFERREKSFLDASHSLGMTGFWPVTGVLCAPFGLLRTCLAQVNPVFEFRSA